MTAFVSRWNLERGYFKAPVIRDKYTEVTIDWGDGHKSNISGVGKDQYYHEYKTCGKYTISITGKTRAISIYPRDKQLLLSVLSIGDLGLNTLHGAFKDCVNMTSFTGEIENCISDLSWMFGYCLKLWSVDIKSKHGNAIRSFGDMFYSCQSLTKVNLSKLNIDNDNTYFSNVFGGCLKIKQITAPYTTEEKSVYFGDSLELCRNNVKINGGGLIEKYLKDELSRVSVIHNKYDGNCGVGHG
jgi:surface protein